MVIRYQDFLREGVEKTPQQLLYSIVTALAVFQPQLFCFLDNIKNRYVMADNSLLQTILLELSKDKRIETKDTNGLTISVENDWNKLKKCVDAAKSIRTTFPVIKSIQVNNFEMVVITDYDFNVIKNKRYAVNENDLTTILGFTENDVYDSPMWSALIAKWLEIAGKHLKHPFNSYLSQLAHEVQPTWNEYRRKKYSALGLRVDELPRLYYNTLYNYSNDIVYYKEAFKDYNAFCLEWQSVKTDYFNAQIIHPLLNNGLNRDNLFQSLVRKSKGAEPITHYTFDKIGTLVCIPAIDNINTNSAPVTQRILVNKKGETVVVYSNGYESIKILIKTTTFCPSYLKIKAKHE